MMMDFCKPDDDGDHDDHDMHAVFDWTVVESDMMMTDGVEGDFADYHIVHHYV